MNTDHFQHESSILESTCRKLEHETYFDNSLHVCTLFFMIRTLYDRDSLRQGDFMTRAQSGTKKWLSKPTLTKQLRGTAAPLTSCAYNCARWLSIYARTQVVSFRVQDDIWFAAGAPLYASCTQVSGSKTFSSKSKLRCKVRLQRRQSFLVLGVTIRTMNISQS